MLLYLWLTLDCSAHLARGCKGLSRGLPELAIGCIIGFEYITHMIAFAYTSYTVNVSQPATPKQANTCKRWGEGTEWRASTAQIEGRF
jgi:hypothetical protein